MKCCDKADNGYLHLSILCWQFPIILFVNICDRLPRMVPFVQFKKLGKQPRRSVAFSKVAGLPFLNCTVLPNRATHHILLLFSETHLEPTQTSKIELFTKAVNYHHNGFHQLTIFTKSSILNVDWVLNVRFWFYSSIHFMIMEIGNKIMFLIWRNLKSKYILR